MDKLIKKIGYEFKNRDLLITALTHSSYANENKTESYERLEFLGDSVLSFIVSDYIYNNFTELPEGGLSKLRSAIVCERSLEQCAVRLGLGDCLRLSRGEDMTGGRTRPSILCDVFESVLAAIFIDGGTEPSREFVMRNLSNEIELAHSGNAVFKDYKTRLQELVQKHDEHVAYSQLSESGPDHKKRFNVCVTLNGQELAKGSGRSKKDAEQNAAKNAIAALRENGYGTV